MEYTYIYNALSCFPYSSSRWASRWADITNNLYLYTFLFARWKIQCLTIRVTLDSSCMRFLGRVLFERGLPSVCFRSFVCMFCLLHRLFRCFGGAPAMFTLTRSLFHISTVSLCTLRSSTGLCQPHQRSEGLDLVWHSFFDHGQALCVLKGEGRNWRWKIVLVICQSEWVFERIIAPHGSMYGTISRSCKHRVKFREREYF